MSNTVKVKQSKVAQNKHKLAIKATTALSQCTLSQPNQEKVVITSPTKQITKLLKTHYLLVYQAIQNLSPLIKYVQIVDKENKEVANV